MAVAVQDEAAKLKAELAVAKKRASELQGEADAFAKERKKFQDSEDSNAALSARLDVANEQIDSLKAELKDAQHDLAALAKKSAKNKVALEAASQIAEGLKLLGAATFSD